ncbi:hypothetical protein L9F63_003337, partial [Diploptera punctata]
FQESFALSIKIASRYLDLLVAVASVFFKFSAHVRTMSMASSVLSKSGWDWSARFKVLLFNVVIKLVENFLPECNVKKIFGLPKIFFKIIIATPA